MRATPRPESKVVQALPRQRLSSNADDRVIFIFHHSGLSAGPYAPQTLVRDDVAAAELFDEAQ